MNNQDDPTTDASADRFSERATALFDDSVHTLDAQTRSRLNRARQNAVSQATPNRFRTYWVSAAAAVAVVAVAGAMLWSAQELGTEYVPPAVTSDFEILLDPDSLELLEDLEFYSWMDESVIAGGDVG
ncbi:MAG: DUF3619 family protein [Woeseia sp.]